MTSIAGWASLLVRKDTNDIDHPGHCRASLPGEDASVDRNRAGAPHHRPGETHAVGITACCESRRG